MPCAARMIASSISFSDKFQVVASFLLISFDAESGLNLCQFAWLKDLITRFCSVKVENSLSSAAQRSDIPENFALFPQKAESIERRTD